MTINRSSTVTCLGNARGVPPLITEVNGAIIDLEDAISQPVTMRNGASDLGHSFSIF